MHFVAWLPRTSSILNNTLYNENREVRTSWAAGAGAAFTQFTDSSYDCATHFPDNMNRCPNGETIFQKNVLIDNLQPGYVADTPPLIRIWGGPGLKMWATGSTRENFHASENIYFRRDGDYRFKNSDPTDTLDTPDLALFQSTVGVEQGSLIATQPVLRIQADPSLDPEDPRSYEILPDSEAANLSAGAALGACP